MALRTTRGSSKIIASGASLYTLAPSKSFGLLSCLRGFALQNRPNAKAPGNVSRSGSECQSGLECSALAGRGIAQPGSAPALGAGGLRFKSGCPDHRRPRRRPHDRAEQTFAIARFDACSKVIGVQQVDNGACFSRAPDARCRRSVRPSPHPAGSACRIVNNNDCCAAKRL
jgi:hypothetical protein